MYISETLSAMPLDIRHSRISPLELKNIASILSVNTVKITNIALSPFSIITGLCVISLSTEISEDCE